MNRREFLSSSAGAMLAAAAPAPRPNIIFILADDLGYGNLGCYGQERIATPRLDQLAREGVRFTQAYAGATVCAPSRCCLMTGKDTGHATVRGNKNPELGLKTGEPTVASVLKQAGYRTALFGKWGLGGFDVNSHPATKGFDEFFGYLSQVHAHMSFPESLWDNRSEMFLKDNWFDQRKTFSNDLFTRRALDFLEKQQRNPFLMFLTYTSPHADNELGALRGNGIETPDQGRYRGENWPEVEKNFASIVTRMDADIGRVLDSVDRLGIAENTLVVFTSDNGPHKEGGHNPSFFRDSGPLRGIKRDLYEGGIRVPSIARWKGKIAPGEVSEFPWAFWDVLPTAAEIAGVRPPPAIDGMSILPTLLGRAQKPHSHFYWEFHEGGFQQAVRSGDWKLVRQLPDFRPRLFNLKDDPGESRDVSSENATEFARLQRLCTESRVPHPEFPVSAKSTR